MSWRVTPVFSPRDLRALRYGALAMLALVLVGKAVPHAVRSDRAIRANALLQVDALRRATAALSRSAPKRRDTAAGPFSGSIPPVLNRAQAHAQLAREASEAVLNAGGHLGSVELLEGPPAPAGYAVPCVRIQFSAGLEEIVLVIADLEDGTPLLRIVELSIAPDAAPLEPSAAAQLTVTMRIEGIYRMASDSTGGAA